MGNSFYVQIAPYLLLEYTYGDSSSTYISNQVKLARIKNDYYNGECQLLNTSPSTNVTQNVLNNSAARISGTRWASLNTDVPTPYINTDPKIIYNDLSGLITSAYVMYDKVRVHILSGYRLDDLDGLIIQIYGKQAQNSIVSILTNNVYLNSDDRDILNPRPVILGDKMYDRYIEVLIPSVKEVNQDFYANPNNPISIGYQYTSDNRGLLFQTGIYVKIFEITTSDKKNGNLFFNTGNDYEVVVNQVDMYSALSAVIGEAPDGDYFQYYPTYGGNFVGDFIAELNAVGGDYIIINDLDVYEQVGADEVLTFSFSQVQTGGFDQAIQWRPIVKYADTAVSFSIEYTARIFNRQNGFQIIRRATTTSYSPRKYGRNLEKIALAVQSYPLKVYNKVVDGPKMTFGEPASNSKFNTVYIPAFYDLMSVVVQNYSINTPTATTNGGVYFGQGDAMVYLSDFDSYIKFKVNTIDMKKNALTNVDLTKGDISIVFKDAKGKHLTIAAESSIPENSKALGEILFKLPSTLKKAVLYDTSTKNFSIIVESAGTSPTTLYNGKVDSIDNVSKEVARVANIKSQSTALTSILETKSRMETLVSNLSNSASAVSLGGKTGSLLSELIKTDSKSLTSDDKLETTPPTIPGYTNDTNAISIKSGVRPVASTAVTAVAGATGTSTTTSASGTTGKR